MDYFNSHRTSSRRLRSKLALQTLANEANNELIINKNLFNEVKHIQDQIIFTKQLFSKLTNTPDSIKAVLLMQNEFLLNNGSLSKVIDVKIDENNNTAVLLVVLVPKKIYDKNYNRDRLGSKSV
jgi:hypothetical protein